MTPNAERTYYLRNPNWSSVSAVHDWRNYIGINTRAHWDEFTDEQRYALYLDADNMASREEWD